MEIIDTHAHLFRTDIERKAINYMEKKSGFKCPGYGTLEYLKQEMIKNNISMAIILPVATKPKQVNSINKFLKTINSSKILPFAAYHPDIENPYKTLSDIKKSGFLGLKLHPEYQEFRWSEEKIQNLGELCEKLGLIIYTHAGYDMGFRETHFDMDEFVDFAKNFPKLKIIAAHMGGFLMWNEVWKKLPNTKNVFIDTSFAFPYLDNISFKNIVNKMGIEKVIFGTDFPWQKYEKYFYYLSRIFSDKELEYIYSSNTKRLLKT